VEPEHLHFGGGVSGSILNPAVVLLMILTGVLMCFLPQKKVIVPFLLTSILIPSDQVLVVAGLHFPLLRVLILFGMIRIFVIRGRGEWNVFSGGLNRVDKALILLSVTSAVAGILLFQNAQIVIFQLGELYTVLGAYFLLRCLIRDHEDVVRVIRTLAVIVAAVGSVMAIEQLTKGWDPYALLGGARAQVYAADMVRDSQIRATGSFAHPILAGTFGAVLMPLFLGIWLTERKYRGSAILGMIGATTMTMASHSSTPLIGYGAGLLGLCVWPIRGSMRLIRWSIVIILVSLQMVMKAPVYHLVTRVDISGSSYHRYALIDLCVRHFGDWWLIGTKSNADWGWDMWDTANEYVEHAFSGGLLSLILFITIIVYGFKYLGQAGRTATDKKQALFFWALSSALLAHAMSFFGISYWDQTIVGWYALLAFIGAIAVPPKLNAFLPQFRPEVEPRTESSQFAPANHLALPWQ